MKSKFLMKILAGTILAFIIINAFWYGIRAVKYNCYIRGMEKSSSSTILVPQYSNEDDEGFMYSVFYPGYFHLEGNLFVGSPSMDENNPYTNSLIIWPLMKGGYEYGVLLYVDSVQYQIYIDENGSAIYEEDKEIIFKHKEQVQTLLRKANIKWNLK